MGEEKADFLGEIFDVSFPEVKACSDTRDELVSVPAFALAVGTYLPSGCHCQPWTAQDPWGETILNCPNRKTDGEDSSVPRQRRAKPTREGGQLEASSEQGKGELAPLHFWHPEHLSFLSHDF